MKEPTAAEKFFAVAMSPAFRDDPYPLYDRFRGRGLVRVADTIWFALAHAEVVELLRHPKLSSSETRATTEIGEAEAGAIKSRSLLFMDPPGHTRLRGLIAQAFTPKRIDGLRNRTESIATELLNRMADRSTTAVDLIDSFAYPLPVRVICALLGVPETDEASFTTWSRGIARSVDPSALRSPAIDKAIEQAELALEAYLRDLLNQRRRNPKDDLLSALLAVEASGDRISIQEVVDLAMLLLVAGHETTVNLIGNAVYALLQAPDQMDLLRRSPELITEGVDELLRYDSPVQFGQRVATEDLDLCGSSIRAGDEIMLLLGAANRDPLAFEQPNRLDLTRKARRHVAFGGGIHHCLGATLARMEGQIALSALLQRYSHIEAAGKPERRPTLTLRGLEHFNVQLTAAGR
jgi:cytochrome P450